MSRISWKELLSGYTADRSFHFYDDSGRAAAIFFEINQEIPSTIVYGIGDEFARADKILDSLRKEFKLEPKHCISRIEMSYKGSKTLEKMILLLISKNLFVYFGSPLQADYTFIIYYCPSTRSGLMEKVKRIVMS